MQPHDRGTAAGVLLPLLAVAERDPLALVTLLPSDHFVADEPRFAAALRVAQEGAELLPERVLVVGVEPDAPEPGYGWILPEPRRRGLLHPVQRFVEKPDRAAATALMQAGAVWNTFVLVGRAEAFLQLYRRRTPRLLDAFERARVHDRPRTAARLYASLPVDDFCSMLLQGSEPHLVLCTAPPCGWTDLGTPERVAACASWLVRHRGVALRSGSLGAAAGAVAARAGGTP